MTRAEELCASYASRLRDAAFIVETATEETTYGTHAVLIATKGVFQVSAEWRTGIAPARTRFIGAWCGEHPESPAFQPRKAQGVRAIDDLIALDDMSRWRTVDGFQRWADERGR